MDEIGIIMVAGALIWFVWGDDRMKKWPFMLVVFVLGAILYFIDKALSRPRR